MTDATQTCAKCGGELPTDAPSGICPKCLMAAGLASESAASEDAPTTPQPHSVRFTPAEPSDLAPRFPLLEILELIGVGGMGAVYKARQPGLDRLVAVKILPPEVGADPAFAQRFRREARALAKLTHQHIVSVHEFGTADGLYYFIMEYVDGTNLRQLMATGEMKPAEALAIVTQICEALQFAHDEDVVHRDIKPENILVDKRGRVKIADFGLARLLGKGRPDVSLTGTHQVLGTLRYMAPEQMEGSRAVDHRADIYSLGVVFYEMLTGEVPAGHFEPPSQKVELDVRLDEVVLRTLAREPERRYQQASSVKTDIESISSSSLPNTQSIDKNAIAQPGEADLAQFSRKAIAGAVLATLFLATLGSLFAVQSARSGDLAIIGIIVGFVSLVACVGSGPGSCIVGMIAINDIRQSQGRISGLGLAFVDSIVFPLVLLDGLIVSLGLRVNAHVSGLNGLSLSTVVFTILTIMVADVLMVVVAWRATTGSIDRNGRAKKSDLANQAPAANSIQKLSIAMLVLGGMCLISIALVAVWLAVDGAERMFAPSEPGIPRNSFLATVVLSSWYAALVVPQALVIVAAALGMRNLRWYWLAVVASVLAALPLSVMWPIGLPIALWGLAVLTRPDVRAEFKRNVPPQLKSPAERLYWPATLLIIAGVVDCAQSFVCGGLFVSDLPPQEIRGQVLVLFIVAPFVLGALRLTSGVQMRRLHSYGFALSASVTSLLPISFGAIVGLPATIWALVVLGHSEVKQSFAATKKGSTGNAVQLRPPMNPAQMLLTGIMCTVAVLGILIGVAVVAATFLLETQPSRGQFWALVGGGLGASGGCIAALFGLRWAARRR